MDHRNLDKEMEMKVERFCGYSENGIAESVTMRVLRTTCPLCRKPVEFTMTNEDFMAEENKFLSKENDRLRDEIHRLNIIINTLVYIK